MPGIRSFGYILLFPSYPSTLLSYYGVGRMAIYSIGLRGVKVKMYGMVTVMVLKNDRKTHNVIFFGPYRH